MRVVLIVLTGLGCASSAAAQTPAMRRAAPPPPMAPAIVAVPPPYTTPMSAERASMPVKRVMIRMVLGNQLLWNGPLNIGGAGGQSRIMLNEPVDNADGCDRPEMGRAYRQIELTISTQYRSSTAHEYRLSARYARPSEDGGCPAGTRTISIEQSFALDPRKGNSFEGDGGLKVQISNP